VTSLDDIVTQLERQRDAIDNALEALRGISAQSSGDRTGAERSGKRRGPNSEGRHRQIEAMRRYWAAKKAGKKTALAKKKTGLTVAGRRKLSENMHKRWAAKRKAAAA
jgi:hypothetical protein